MTLSAGGLRKERILAYGASGSGKSSIWLNIANWIKRTNSPSRILLLDTDFTAEAMLPADGSLDDVVIVEQAADWKEMKPAIKRLVAKGVAGRGDWLVYDMIDKVWSKSQDGFFEFLTDKDIDVFLMEAVKEGASLGGDWGVNWQAINKMYGELIAPIVRFPGHVLALAPAADVREPDRSGKGGDDARIRGLFSRLGVKPQGQKDLPHLFHTVLLMQESPKGWTMTTAKDRERARVGGVVLGGESGPEPGFVMKYLLQIAGWKP